MFNWIRSAAAAIADRVAAPSDVLTTRELVRRYGDPGLKRAEVDPAWRRKHVITCRDGNGDRPSMPGVPTRFYFDVHRDVEPAMRAAFEAARHAAPDYVIERAGCFVFRHQRHDDTRPLSRHSWAIAVDVNADKNGARTFAPGKTPAPFSAAWAKVWPDGVPELFVTAFESHGFVWGGRWRGYCDPMHFEYAGPG